MRLTNTLIPLLLSFATVPAFAQTVVDTCPKGDYACLDVINSSQCIEQIIIEKLHNVTKEALVKCVEFEGMSANITGAAKYCRCPGCHTAPINKVITEMFPPPCGS